jgi:hypothetical protein
MTEAGVRPVRAEAIHRLGVRHSRDLGGPLCTDTLHDLGHHAFHQAEHVLLRAEGHLDVDLGELGLAVGAQVLVAEAPGDLVVAIHPATISSCLKSCGDCGSA